MLVLEVAILENLGVVGLGENDVDSEVEELDFLAVVQNEILGFGRVAHRVLGRGPAEKVLVDLPHLLVENLEVGLGHAELLEDL